MAKWLKHLTVDQRVPGWNPTCCCSQVKHFLHPSSPWETSLWLKGPEVKINYPHLLPSPRPFSALVQGYMNGRSFKFVLLLSCVCSILSIDVRKWRVSIALVSWHTFLFRHPCSRNFLYTLQHGNGASVYSSNLTNCSSILPNPNSEFWMKWDVYILYDETSTQKVIVSYTNLHQVHDLCISLDNWSYAPLLLCLSLRVRNTILCQRIQAYL